MSKILERVMKNGQYLRLDYFIPGQLLLPHNVHRCGYLKYILPPYLGLPLLYWKYDRQLSNGYDVFIPRLCTHNHFLIETKKISSLFLEDLLSLLEKYWNNIHIGISNPYTFSNWRFRRTGNIKIFGFRRDEYKIRGIGTEQIKDCVNKYMYQ